MGVCVCCVSFGLRFGSGGRPTGMAPRRLGRASSRFPVFPGKISRSGVLITRVIRTIKIRRDRDTRDDRQRGSVLGDEQPREESCVGRDRLLGCRVEPSQPPPRRRPHSRQTKPSGSHRRSRRSPATSVLMGRCDGVFWWGVARFRRGVASGSVLLAD